MGIGTICKRIVVTARPFDELTTAAKRMREEHIGYLVVTEPDVCHGGVRPVGVLTDRDIVIAVVAGGADAKTLRVGDVMTESPVTVRESNTVAATLQAMRRIGVRRMPIVDAFGRLQGVVSLDDIIETLAGELGDVAESIRNERRVEGALRR
jgi:CBS domain-containing protein